MKFSIDGKEFNVIVTKLARKGRVSESKLSGDVKSGTHFRDIIGTYYDYEMTVGSNALSETEYDTLFEILTAPVESHEVVLPYGAGTLTFQAYIEETSDSMTADNGKPENGGICPSNSTHRSPKGGRYERHG